MDGKTGELLALLLQLKNHFRGPRRHAPSVRGNEHFILHAVAHAQQHGEAVGISQLSRMMGVTQPTVTQSVQLLVEKGLIERTPDPGDRRAVCLRLTNKGEENRQAHNRESIAFLERYVEHLGAEDVDHLLRILQKTQTFFSHYECDLEDSFGSTIPPPFPPRDSGRPPRKKP